MSDSVKKIILIIIMALVLAICVYIIFISKEKPAEGQKKATLMVESKNTGYVYEEGTEENTTDEEETAEATYNNAINENNADGHRGEIKMLSSVNYEGSENIATVPISPEEIHTHINNYFTRNTFIEDTVVTFLPATEVEEGEFGSIAFVYFKINDENESVFELYLRYEPAGDGTELNSTITWLGDKNYPDYDQGIRKNYRDVVIN